MDLDKECKLELEGEYCLEEETSEEKYWLCKRKNNIGSGFGFMFFLFIF
jgi:hypothetical protein